MPRPDDNIFVCVSQYQMPRDQVVKHVPEHREWLKEQDAKGRVIATGRQASGLGGILVMAARDEQEMRGIVAEDPLQVHGCTAYWIFEFQLNPDPESRGELMGYFFKEFPSAESE